MLVPIYGFLRGDTLGLVLLVHDDQHVRDLARSMREAAGPRTAPPGELATFFEGRRLDPDSTIAEAGIQPLDRVDFTSERSVGS